MGRKNLIFQQDALVYGDIILNFAGIPHFHVRADENVLTDAAVFADHRALEDVGEMPDFGTGADDRAFVHI